MSVCTDLASLIGREKVICPGDPNYPQDSKDFNDLYPVSPLAIVYATDFQDVRTCLAYAQQPGNRFQTVIRSGGHSLAGYSVCDGLIIDMSKINDVFVDTHAYTATVSAGCNFMRLNSILEFYGFHLPGGGCPTVAVAGYMMGGGYGFTSRTFGMNCDCVMEVTVMLANGQVVVANEDQNEDLFWAIRGGTGGNFGVLMTIKYRIFPLGDIYGVQLQWPVKNNAYNAATALYTIQEQYLRGFNFPSMGIQVATITDPNDQTNKLVTFCATWVGSLELLNEAVAPLKAIPTTIVSMDPNTDPKMHAKYSHINNQLLSNVERLPMGIKAFSRSAYVSRPLEITDYEAILNYFLNTPNGYTIMDFECYGGVINQVPAYAMAFRHRDVLFDIFTDAFFEEPMNREQNNQWLNEFYLFLSQYTNGYSYQNYPNRGQQDWKQAYWGDYYPLLVQIKTKYDPTNFFHYQQSIEVNQSYKQAGVSGPNIPSIKSSIKYEDY